MFPIGVQDDDQKLAGRTSPPAIRRYPAVIPRHRRDAYATLGSASASRPGLLNLLDLSLADHLAKLLRDKDHSPAEAP